LGLAAGFHVLEELSIGVSGEWLAAFETSVPVTGGEQTTRRYNHPVFGARLDVSWAPLYGKLSLMAESVLHFDSYITASGGVLGPSRDNPEFCWGGAVGQRYFVNEWIAVRWEVRTQFFELKRQPARDNSKSLQIMLTGALGVSFFLPTEVEREKLK
jgi:outer membrane beta-barrel protein